MSRLQLVPRALAGALLAWSALACRDPNAIQASFPTGSARVTVYDINTPSLSAPNAIALIDIPQAVRAAPEYSFDLAVTFDAAGVARLHGVHLVANEIILPGNRSVGIQKVTEGYEALVVAPTRGYAYEQPTVLALGDVGVIEALNHPFCSFQFGFPNVYAKFEVEAIDVAARSVRLRILSNPNCGLRGLEPGVPTR